MEWKTIDSAPNDGSFIVVGRWHMGKWCYAMAQQYHGKWIGFSDPSHWMPLPPPPSE